MAVVGVGHALVLGALPPGTGGGWGGGVPPRPLQVRQIVVVPPPLAAPGVPVAQAAPAARRPAAAASPPPRAAAEAPARAAEATSPLPAPELEAVLAAASSPTPAAPAAPASDGGSQPLPVYRTKAPPAALLRYELHRGALRGSGELNWNPSAKGYQLGLEATAFGIRLINQDSQGGIDAAGLAPERFLDSRRGRAAQAANFRRGEGKVTFSGPAVEFPLVPGTQDRLSFMIQLSAIVAADPKRFGAGAQITMFVVSARGDGDVWTFEAEAAEPLEVPAGRVAAALHLRRQPRKPYDASVDVWLDPARSYLPVRVRQAVAQTDEAYELLLAEQLPR